LEQSVTRLYMKGEGLAGLDEIYCGIECFESTGAYYNWSLVGSWAWRSGRVVDGHPRTSGKKYAYLWNSSIPFWFAVTPRRIIIIAKISSTYQTIHLGLLNPTATDNQNPYPLLIGGCGAVATYTYSAVGAQNSAFWANDTVMARLSIPGGDWLDCFSPGSVGATGASVLSIGYESRATIMPDTSGNYILEELYLCNTVNTSTYGFIDGLFRVSGSGNSAENIITISGTNYLVVPNVYRSSVGDYSALRLD